MPDYSDTEGKLARFLAERKTKDYIFTVEGGASKTIIEVFTRSGEPVQLRDADGDVFSSIMIGPSNINQVTAEALEADMRAAFEETAIASSSASLLSILPDALLIAGVAGLGTERNQAEMRGVLARLGFQAGTDFLIIDGVASLAYVQKPGAMLIAGTGSMVMGSVDGKKVMREGGDGPIFGEPGSGYDVSLKTLHYAIHLERGKYSPRDETDPFAQRIRAFCNKEFGLPEDRSVESLLSPLNQHEFEVGKIAKLAPLVFEHAFEHEHEHAKGIISQVANALGVQLASILRRMPVDQSVNVLLVGGLFKSPHASQFTDQIDASLKRVMPEVKVGYQNSTGVNVVSGLLQKTLQPPLAALGGVPGTQFKRPPGPPEGKRGRFDPSAVLAPA